MDAQQDMIKDTIYAPLSPRCGKVHDPSSLIYPYATSFLPLHSRDILKKE